MLSVSDLTTYLFCTRKLYLQRVYEIYDREPREVTFAGTLQHRILEFVADHDQNLVISIVSLQDNVEEKYKQLFAKAIRVVLLQEKSTLEKLKMDFIQLYKNYMQQFEPLFSQKSAAILSCIQEHMVFGVELWKKLPKIESEYAISSAILELRGIVDQIEIKGEDVIPIEIKTSKPPFEGIHEYHKIQLAAYILLLQEKYPQINYGYLYYVTAYEKRKLVMNPFLKEYVLQLISDTKKLLSEKILPDYCENKKKCESCEIKKYCYDTILITEKNQKLISIRKL